MPSLGDRVQNAVDDALPDGITKLVSLVTIERYGYKFHKQPAAWVVAVILDEFTNWMEMLAAEFAAMLYGLWTLLLYDVLEPVGGAALVGPAEAIGDVILGLVESQNAIISDVSLAAGPFAPFAALLLWALTGLFVGAVLYGLSRAAWLAIKLVTGRP